MRKLLAVAGLLLLYGCGEPAKSQTGGPPNAIVCNKTATGSTAATTTQIAAPVGTQVVSVCGFDSIAGAAAGSFQLIVGTGATCGTGTVNVTASYPLGAGNGIVNSSAFVRYSSAQGAGLCVVTTGTGPTAWTVYYTQF
jgi:hypothetical protein